MRFNGVIYTGALLLGFAALGLSGCGGTDGDSARVAQTVDASKNGVISIQLEDNEGYAHVKGSLQFNLLGRDKDNKATNLNSKASWSLSDKSLGKIKHGLFTASGNSGEVMVTAAYAGMTQSQKLIVSNANLESIDIEAGDAAVDECRNTTLTAKARFEGDLTLSYPLTWAITEGGTRASFKDPAKGELSTRNSGAVTLIAQGEDNNGVVISSAPLTLEIVDSLNSIKLASDKSLTMREGVSAAITATATYKDNSTTTITANTTFSATPSNSLSIDGANITAQNGSYGGTDVTLTGSCGGEAGELALVVEKKEIKSIQIKNSNGGTENLSITEGGNLDLKVTATFADDSTDSNYNYNLEWSIDTSKSDNFATDMITLEQTGRLAINDDLNLAANQQINLIVRVEVRDEDDRIVVNADGQQLVDEINIAVRP